MAGKIYAHEYMILDLARQSQWHFSLFNSIAGGSTTGKSYIYKCKKYLTIQRAGSVLHFLRGSEINSNACAMKIEGFEWLLEHFPNDPHVQKMRWELFDSLFGDGNLYRMIMSRSRERYKTDSYLIVGSKWNNPAFDL
jgi:hypothetical protein